MAEGPYDPIYIWEPHDVYIGKVGDDGIPVLTEEGLTVSLTGVAVNNADVSAQVKDDNGTAVGGAVSLSYVATSTGHYKGVIPYTTTEDLTAGSIYHVWVTSTSGEVYRKLVYEARYRGRT